MNKKRLKFYTVNTEYMLYLKKYDIKIMENSGNKSQRPYIGILFEIDNKKYLAPLTSPKPKHLKMKNTLDFIKIDGGKLGAINLNNMFPVIDQVIIPKNIKLEENLNYKELLTDQINWCNKKENSTNILKKAEALYNEITQKKENSIFWNRCCNFKVLEDKSSEYLLTKENKWQKEKNLKNSWANKIKKDREEIDIENEIDLD